MYEEADTGNKDCAGFPPYDTNCPEQNLLVQIAGAMGTIEGAIRAIDDASSKHGVVTDPYKTKLANFLSECITRLTTKHHPPK